LKRYAIIIEQGETSFGAYAPDLPGVIAVAKTREECERLMAEAIEFHIEGLKEDGLPVPEPHSFAAEVVVAA
jgi:predicted RNase H-like HicB family nuclease